MKRITQVLFLLTPVVFVSGVMAQGKPAPAPAPPAKLQKFFGDIKSVDAAAKTIVGARWKELKTFVVDERTKIIRGKDTLSLDDLKRGLNISIEFKKEMDKLIAVSIKAGKPKGTPK